MTTPLTDTERDKVADLVSQICRAHNTEINAYIDLATTIMPFARRRAKARAAYATTQFGNAIVELGFSLFGQTTKTAIFVMNCLGDTDEPKT